jgi:RNA polymerase sigma factor (TIGR02999 family)
LEPTGDITVLLERWQSGDPAALDTLMPLIYPRLKTIATSLEPHAPGALGLQATALVNEAFLRLVKQQRAGWESREHFFSLAALAMRQILTDAARTRLAVRRGGTRQRVPLHEDLQWVSIDHEEILDLNLALKDLAGLDARKVRVVELRYFLGCTAEETAELLGVSKATVDREAEVARAWLFRRLKGTAAREQAPGGSPPDR